MSLDPSDGGPVPADLDGIDPRPVQQPADLKAFIGTQSAPGEIAGIDLDGDMQPRRFFPDALQDLKKDAGPLFGGPASIRAPACFRIGPRYLRRAVPSNDTCSG